MPSHLDITNGDAAADLLREARGHGTVLPWRDVLCCGPVPPRLTLTKLSAVRASFIRSTGWDAVVDAEQAFAERDTLLSRHGEFETVTLWFDDDPNDTLQLLQILSFFADSGRSHKTLRLVRTEKPLTGLSVARIAVLAGKSRPVQRQQLNVANTAWSAYRSADPRAWAAMLVPARLGLKHLWSAVMHTVHELPATETGISSSERHILAALALAPSTPRALFSTLSCRSFFYGMTDWWFWHILGGLIDANHPLVAGREGPGVRPGTVKTDQSLDAPLSLTPFGRQVLEGKADHAAHNSIDRWMGGTHITNSNLWRLDPSSDKVIAPRSGGR